MNSARVLLITFGLILIAQFGSAQELSRYRAYDLGSSLSSVVAINGVRAADIKTLHERPAKIQELEWRAWYVSSGSEFIDPVRDVAFTFVDEALYQIVVTYDRGRTDGLTNSDLIASLTAVYGEPAPRSARSRPVVVPADTTVVAQWDDIASSVTLVRGTYSSTDLQLILISKVLTTRAQGAIREAVRLDAIEAPRRELEQRKKEATDASAARDKVRTANKAAFHP